MKASTHLPTDPADRPSPITGRSAAEVRHEITSREADAARAHRDYLDTITSETGRPAPYKKEPLLSKRDGEWVEVWPQDAAAGVIEGTANIFGEPIGAVATIIQQQEAGIYGRVRRGHRDITDRDTVYENIAHDDDALDLLLGEIDAAPPSIMSRLREILENIMNADTLASLENLLNHYSTTSDADLGEWADDVRDFVGAWAEHLAAHWHRRVDLVRQEALRREAALTELREPFRQAREQKRDQRLAVRNDRSAGLSEREIAELRGLSRYAVRKLLREDELSSST